MTLTDILILLVAGTFAGFINTIAGGGSLLTMPVLIFMGLPSVDANGTNRVAIFIQNIFSTLGFKSKGVQLFPFTFWVAIPAVAGALVGANIALDIPDELFNKILSVVMVLVALATIFKPKIAIDTKSLMTKKRTGISMILFFFIGIYGGFIQAGTGFLIISALGLVHRMGMAQINGVKVFVIMSYTVVALLTFYLNGNIWWTYGLTLAVGNSTGGWIASRWSVKQSDKLIRIILLIMIGVLSVKVWFFHS